MGFWSKLGKMMGFEKEYIDEDYIDYDKRKSMDMGGNLQLWLTMIEVKCLTFILRQSITWWCVKPTTYEDTESVVTAWKQNQ